MNIKYVDLSKQYSEEKDEILKELDKVLSSGHYIGGEQVSAFETSFSKYTDCKYAVAVANGTESLVMIMKLLGIGAGDEVITAPNSWISSASSIALAGAKPVFADVGADYNIDPEKIEEKINKNTKAIMPVHLTGKSAKMDEILAIAKKYNLHVIEDAAQAIGTKYKGTQCGNFGEFASFSLHPLKNLNCCGDGGVITTNNDAYAEKLKLIGQHGMPNRETAYFWGYNSRLDALQAAILNIRIKKLDSLIAKRRENAAAYRKLLQNVVELPVEDDFSFDTFHLFVIQSDRRNELREYLQAKGVTTAIHYPTPIHLQPAAKYLGYKKGDFPVTEKQADRILSLPINQTIGEKEVNFISETIIDFVKQK